MSFCAGEAVVVPAAVERFILKPQWELEFICSSLPVEQVAHPETVLLESTAGTAQPQQAKTGLAGGPG